MMYVFCSLTNPQLKGHCAGDGGGGQDGRVTVILEQGNPLQMIQLLQSPWEDRFRVSELVSAVDTHALSIYPFTPHCTLGG